MQKEKLTVGMSYSDRVAPLLERRVQSPGIELEFDSGPVDQIFWRGLHSSDFDLMEMSLAAHCILVSRGDTRFVGLPIFTSRIFRHASVYVAADSGIEAPAQLAGRRVGLPEYQMTAAVWMRGIFREHYGLDLKGVHWVAGGVDRPGRKERIALELPADYRLTRIPEERTLSDMLLKGEIDALISAKMPRAFADGSGRMRRLFRDARAEEAAYFARTGHFPIMHLAVLRREVYERRPEVAAEVFDLFERARQLSLERAYDPDALTVMSPWLIYEVEAARAALGRDYWPYGLERNRACLETFLGYLDNQGLLRRPIGVEDVFLKETKKMDGAVKEVSDASFGEAVLGSGTPVLVDCWAEWCKPCVGMQPALEALAKAHAGKLVVAKLNVDQNPALAKQHNIRSLPTLLVVKGGEIVGRKMGAMTGQQMSAWLEQVLGREALAAS